MRIARMQERGISGKIHDLNLGDFKPVPSRSYSYGELARSINYSKFYRGEWENGYGYDKFYEEMRKRYGEKADVDFFKIEKLDLIVIIGSNGIFPTILQEDEIEMED